jgi:hypothetical protein
MSQGSHSLTQVHRVHGYNLQDGLPLSLGASLGHTSLMMLLCPAAWPERSKDASQDTYKTTTEHHDSALFTGMCMQVAATIYIPHSQNMSNEHVCCADSSPSAYQLFFLVTPSTVLTFAISDLRKMEISC